MRRAILVGLLGGASAGWTADSNAQLTGRYKGFEVRVDGIQQGARVGGQFSAIQSIRAQLPGHEMLALRLKFQTKAAPPEAETWVSEKGYGLIAFSEVSLQDQAGAVCRPWNDKYAFELAKFNKKRTKGEVWLYFVVPEGLEPKTASLRLRDQVLKLKK